MLTKALRRDEGITKCIHVRVKYFSPALYASDCSQKRPPNSETGLSMAMTMSVPTRQHSHACRQYRFLQG